LSADSPTACNGLSFGYELNRNPSAVAIVGSKPATCPGPTPTSLGGAVIGPFDSAVLVRVLLRDDSCSTPASEVVFYSDGDHAGLDPEDPFVVWMMDADGNCSALGPRPPVEGDLNLRATLAVLP